MEILWLRQSAFGRAAPGISPGWRRSAHRWGRGNRPEPYSHHKDRERQDRIRGYQHASNRFQSIGSTAGANSMKQSIQKRIVRASQQGYAILTVMFFLTLLVLSTIVVAPNVVTDVQRQKEEEMIWRGKQYVRGVRLYYTKLHRFPTQLEDLYKPKTGIRFIRQAYKDPVNTADGSWRLIYVGPSGQLIGSLKDHSMTGNVLGMGPASASGFGTPMGANGNSPTGASSSSGFGSSLGSSMPGSTPQGAVPGAQNANGA